MAEEIYRGYDFDRDIDVVLESSPNAWTSYHLSSGGYHLMSYDSLVIAANELCRVVAELGGDPVEVVNAVVDHFNDDKIYMGEIEDGQLPYLVNEYEWDEEGE